MKYLLLLSLCCYALYGHAQIYTADEAAGLKTDTDLEAIIFSGKPEKLKTLLKKLPLFPGISRIVIEADFDTAYTRQVLEMIKDLESIEEIDISAGNTGQLPASLDDCRLIKVLKIYNTSKMNPAELERAISSISSLEQFSWINNGIPIPLVKSLYNLPEIEIIDTTRAITPSEIQTYMSPELQQLSLGVNRLEDIPSLKDYPKIEGIRIVDLPRFKGLEDIDYLCMEEEYTETTGIENKERSVAVSYSGASHTLNEAEMEILTGLLPEASAAEEEDTEEEEETGSRRKNWGMLSAAPAPVRASTASFPAIGTAAFSGGVFWSIMNFSGGGSGSGGPGDTTSFDSRYNSNDYYYLSKFRRKRDTVAYVNRFYDKKAGRYLPYINSNKIMVKSTRNLVKMSTMAKEPDDSSDYVKVAFLSTTTLKAFPELAQFHGYGFCVEGYRKNRMFKAEYVKNKIYSDVRIIYVKGDATGTIELKTRSGYISIPFEVSNIYNKRRPASAIRSFSRMYGNYLKVLDKRRNAFNDRIMQRYNSSNKRQAGRN